MHHEILASSSWTAMKLKKKGSKGCRDTAASQLRISYELLENKNPIDKLTVISTTKSTVPSIKTPKGSPYTPRTISSSLRCLPFRWSNGGTPNNFSCCENLPVLFDSLSWECQPVIILLAT